MFLDLQSHLAELQKCLGADASTLKKALGALGRHHNLRAYKDHMGIVRLCSADVNSTAANIEVTHRTQECGGALEIMVYTDEQGAHVYADPPLYVVGFSNPHGFGEVPLKDWVELLTDAGLSIEAIRKVRSYLGRHAPINFDQVRDEAAAP